MGYANLPLKGQSKDPLEKNRDTALPEDLLSCQGCAFAYLQTEGKAQALGFVDQIHSKQDPTAEGYAIIKKYDGQQPNFRLPRYYCVRGGPAATAPNSNQLGKVDCTD